LKKEAKCLRTDKKGKKGKETMSCCSSGLSENGIIESLNAKKGGGNSERETAAHAGKNEKKGGKSCAFVERGMVIG